MDEISSKIELIDLRGVKDKLRSKKGWWWLFWNDLDKLEAEYRKFLYLIAEDPTKTVVPWTQALDDFWHEHILDTRKYQEDCDKIFGKLIHHNPNLPKGTEEHTKAVKSTKKSYQSNFKSKSSSGSSPIDSYVAPIDFGSSISDHSSSHSSCGSSSSSCSSSSCGSSCGGGGD